MTSSQKQEKYITILKKTLLFRENFLRNFCGAFRRCCHGQGDPEAGTGAAEPGFQCLPNSGNMLKNAAGEGQITFFQTGLFPAGFRHFGQIVRGFGGDGFGGFIALRERFGQEGRQGGDLPLSGFRRVEPGDQLRDGGEAQPLKDPCVKTVAGPRPSSARTTAARISRPMAQPLPQSSIR